MTQRPDAPGPLHRLGPRPLILHLMLAMQRKPIASSAWHDVWKSWSAGSPDWKAAAAQAEDFSRQGLVPDAALIAGIAAYRRHPWRRDMPDPPAIWQEGSARLLDYGAPGSTGAPVLFIPSLVNRAYVLDLLPDHSMLRFLAASGLRPLLLDWGFPVAEECEFTLTDYVAGRVERAVASVGMPLTLAGYCLGGLMAVAAAQRRPDLVRRLVLLATPWDFWAANAAHARRAPEFLPLLEPAFAFGGGMPVDALQMLFSLLEPGGVGAKYRDFGAQDQTSPRARMFVAMEDWLNDGVPLAAPVAREVLGGWYGRNTPAAGCWRIAAAPVRPETLSMPSFVAIPGRDRIVPPESAIALARSIPGAVVHRPRGGHVGMVAGSGARAALWEPMLAWLRRE
jgi:poly(3-hydroxyalkanoate) synthetase